MQIAFALTNSVGEELLVCHFLYDDRPSEMFQYWTRKGIDKVFSEPWHESMNIEDPDEPWKMLWSERNYNRAKQEFQKLFESASEWRGKTSFNFKEVLGIDKDFPVGNMEFRLCPPDIPDAAWSVSVKDSRVDVTYEEIKQIWMYLKGRGWEEFDTETWGK